LEQAHFTSRANHGTTVGEGGSQDTERLTLYDLQVGQSKVPILLLIYEIKQLLRADQIRVKAMVSPDGLA
jgi:hypothetical protein